MKLNIKIFYLLFTLIASYVAIRYLFQIFVIMPEFERMEYTLAIDDLERTKNLITREVRNISSTAMDWSEWDDTYNFLKDHNQKYINTNLTYNTLLITNKDIFLMYDENGRLYWGDISEDTNTPFKKTEMIRNMNFLFISNYKDLLFKSDSKRNDAIAGIIESIYGPILLAITPILNSEPKYPCLGSIVMGKFLNKEYVTSLSEAIKIPFDIYLLNGNTPQDINLICEKINLSKQKVYIDESSSKNKLYLYSYLEVLKGSCPIVIKIEASREVFLRTNNIMQNSMLSLIVAGILLVMILWFFLHNIITRPLTCLINSITRISSTKNLSFCLKSVKKDEIGILTREFDKMISTISQTRNDLENNLKEKEKLITELNTAGINIKTLKRLLPICVNCKQIRDDSGYWNQVEAYINKYTDAQFSHSICPECARILYPEIDINSKQQKKS